MDDPDHPSNRPMPICPPAYLNAYDGTLILDDLGECGATVGLVVQSLVEQDDASDAGVDPVVSGEEQLAVEAAVLLGVLHSDGAQALGDAACKERTEGAALDCAVIQRHKGAPAQTPGNYRCLRSLWGGDPL